MSQFVGAWKLIQQVEIRDGNETFPRGENPTGLLIYLADGTMSVQLMRTDRGRFNDMSSLQTALEEYLGYYGRYTVDEAASIVVHHVEGCSFPRWIGTDQVRRYRFEGNQLILSAEGQGVRRVLTWIQVG
jgi:hypothetical protein